MQRFDFTIDISIYAPRRTARYVHGFICNILENVMHDGRLSSIPLTIKVTDIRNVKIEMKEPDESSFIIADEFGN